jgi:hypothetical protein
MPKSVACILVFLFCTASASAQDSSAAKAEPGSRAELLATMRQQKAKTVHPYEPAGIEKALLYMEEHRILDRLSVADGWYPRIGGLATGGGFAGGVGYRKHFANDQFFFNASAAMSAKLYKAVDAQMMFPPIGRDRVEFWTNFKWRDFPQEDFFGIGNESSRGARSNYAIKSTDIGARGLVKVFPWLRFGLDAGLYRAEVGPGTDTRMPSIELLFTDAQAPGLSGEQPLFVYNALFVEIDSRDQPGNARSGLLMRGSFGTWDDREDDQFDFHRFDGEAAYFIPIFDKKRVFAFHMGLSYVNNERGHRVPFYFLPYIGGSDTVRGFREFRFRDENAFYMNAEYRWEAFSGLDMALFADAGEVREDWHEIDFQDLRTSYGIGFRFNTYKAVFMRLDLATGGGEGMRMFLKFGKAF